MRVCLNPGVVRSAFSQPVTLVKYFCLLIDPNIDEEQEVDTNETNDQQEADQDK